MAGRDLRVRLLWLLIVVPLCYFTLGDSEVERSERQYGREDVDYTTWYSDWMKALARQNTIEELEAMLCGKQREASKAAASHHRAIQRSTSMNSNSAARAHARNSTAAAGESAIAIRGALEIHELFPEHAKQGEEK